MCARDEAHWQVSRLQIQTVLTTSRKRHGGLGFAQNIKASYALAAKLLLAIRRHARLMGIPLPIPTVGSLCSQHDDIMAKTTQRHIVIAGMSPF